MGLTFAYTSFVHAATTTSRRQPCDASARSTNRANRTARSSAPKARGVPQFLDGGAVAGFPDRKATVAEVKTWMKTGVLPLRFVKVVARNVEKRVVSL